MGIDIKRRSAFAQAFKDYPGLLASFTDFTTLTDPKTGKTRPTTTKAEKHAVMQILMAQFATRLVRTRAQNADTPDMAWFGFTLGHRYLGYKKSLLADLEIEAEAKYRRAITAVENNMATAIMSALATEAGLPGDFDEPGFWRDVFLSFLQNQQREHPPWHHPIQYIVLDHMPEFEKALAA